MTQPHARGSQASVSLGTGVPAIGKVKNHCISPRCIHRRNIKKR